MMAGGHAAFPSAENQAKERGQLRPLYRDNAAPRIGDVSPRRVPLVSLQGQARRRGKGGLQMNPLALSRAGKERGVGRARGPAGPGSGWDANGRPPVDASRAHPCPPAPAGSTIFCIAGNCHWGKGAAQGAAAPALGEGEPQTPLPVPKALATSQARLQAILARAKS